MPVNCPVQVQLVPRPFNDKDIDKPQQDVKNRENIKEQQICTGALKIVHANVHELGNFHGLRLSATGGINQDGEYRNIKRGFSILQTNIVIQMITIGNCCWETYEKQKFTGAKQYIYYSEYYPDFQPSSIKNFDCKR